MSLPLLGNYLRKILSSNSFFLSIVHLHLMNSIKIFQCSKYHDYFNFKNFILQILLNSNFINEQVFRSIAIILVNGKLFQILIYLNNDCKYLKLKKEAFLIEWITHFLFSKFIFFLLKYLVLMDSRINCIYTIFSQRDFY